MHLIDRIRWLCCRFPAVRGQVRSYGLRPESKADLCITIKWWRSGLCPQGVGELVRESFISGDTSPADVTTLSRTSPLLGLRPESKAGLRITIKWWRSGLCPQGVGANLFAKALFRAIHLLRMSRPFRGQVRSYGLRPESKAGLRITIKWWRSGLCPQGVGANLFAKALFRTIHLLRMSRPFRGQVRSLAFGQNPTQACV